jgi:hypothetical protein
MTDAAAPVIEARDGKTDRGRRIALVVLCAGMLMIVLDATIVNVALPSIQSDLRFSQSSLAWVVNAWVRKCVHAAGRYSCRRPPSRSRRCTRAGGWPLMRVTAAAGCGGSSCSARWGR